LIVHGDNAKFGKTRSDRIDHRSLLTDEEMANSLPMPNGIGLGLEWAWW
jgi:hypothetical protein